jgi:quinol monooxygenase YgiN
MILVGGTMLIRAEAVGIFRSIMSELAAQTRAEEGCRLFSLGVEDERQGRITVLEIWSSEQALARHHEQAYTRKFLETLGDAILRLDLAVYDVSGSRALPELSTLAHVPS